MYADRVVYISSIYKKKKKVLETVKYQRWHECLVRFKGYLLYTSVYLPSTILFMCPSSECKIDALYSDKQNKQTSVHGPYNTHC